MRPIASPIHPRRFIYEGISYLNLSEEKRVRKLCAPKDNEASDRRLSIPEDCQDLIAETLAAVETFLGTNDQEVRFYLLLECQAFTPSPLFFSLVGV